MSNLLKRGWTIMGHMSSLMKQEDISFPSKIKTLTAKKIGSIAVKIVDIHKIHKNDREILIVLLENQHAKKEAEVVHIVENYLSLITTSLKELFAGNHTTIVSYATAIGNRKLSLDHKVIFQQLLPKVKLEQFEMDIKQKIQQEIETLFGVKSLKIASIKSKVDELVYHQQSQDIDMLLSEYRKAIFVAQHMTTVGNKVWDHCLGTFDLPFIPEKVVKKFKIGSLFINIVNCRPENQVQCYQQEIERYLTGVMINIENRINQEMRETTAKVFYELYDQTIASSFDKRLAVLMTGDRSYMVKKKGRAPLYLLKQANISAVI